MKTKDEILSLFNNFPYGDYWKFFIDRPFWSNNEPLLFDKQDSPGYLKALSKAFYTMLAYIDKPLTIELIIGLHDLAYHDSKDERFGFAVYGSSLLSYRSFKYDANWQDGIEELVDTMRVNRTLRFTKINNNKPIPIDIDFNKSTKEITKELIFGAFDKLKEFADCFMATNTFIKTKYGVDLNQIDNSPDLKKICDTMTPSDKEEFYRYENQLKKIAEDYSNEVIHLERKSPIGEVLNQIQSFIDDYNCNLQAANNEREQIATIVKLIVNMHQYHPFPDGNGRTFIFLLLNKLLLQNGLLPTLVMEPHRFSSSSVEQLTDDVIEGQETFKKLCRPLEENSETITAYLEKELNITEKEKFFFTCAIDFNSNSVEHELFDKKYITEQEATTWLNIFSSKYNDKQCELFFNNIAPYITFVKLDLFDFCIHALYRNNLVYLKYYSDFLKSQGALAFISDSFNIIWCMANYIDDWEKICEMFQITGSKIIAILLETYTGESKEINNYKYLILNNQVKILDRLLDCLDEHNFYNVASLDISGINGLQLLYLFQPELFMKYTHKLSQNEIKQLLNNPISTVTEPESSQLQRQPLNIPPEYQMAILSTTNHLRTQGLFSSKEMGNQKLQNDDTSGKNVILSSSTLNSF